MRTCSICLCAALAILSGHALAQNVVYPLDVGTKWLWSLDSSTTSYRIEITRDTLAPNGHRYAIVPTYWSIPERWERQEGTRVYRYAPGVEEEWLLFDFSRSSGDTINQSPMVVMYAAKMDTLFGTIRRTWDFSVNTIPGAIDAGADYIITDSLGLTDYSDYNSALRVTGVMVGSRVYGTITGAIAGRDVLLDRFVLSQNYPNPFNPTTTIGYALPQRSHATLTVYNMLGQVVETLVNGEVEAGSHEVVFDGTGLASGVYVYRLRAGEYVAVKKLIMVR